MTVLILEGLSGEKWVLCSCNKIFSGFHVVEIECLIYRGFGSKSVPGTSCNNIFVWQRKLLCFGWNSWQIMPIVLKRFFVMMHTWGGGHSQTLKFC